MLVRVLAVAALFGAAMYGEDITIPLEGGNILIKDASYSRSPGSSTSLLSFTVANNTLDGWDLKLRLVITSRCDGQKTSQSIPVQVSLRQGASKQCDGGFNSPCVWSSMNKLSSGSGCVLEKMEASLISAENRKLRINGITGERIDLAKQRESEAEAQAKKDASESARQKRIAAEQKKKNAELDARNAKDKAERDAKDAEERRRLRANCTTIYQNTIDKKVKDLTVREEEQVRACQV